MEQGESALRTVWSNQWPRYDSAVLGFKDYWHPVLFSRDLGRRPQAIKLLGESIVLVRDRGRVYGLHDRCPHRGIPLSVEPRREFPGTISCPFHGWTYDLKTGRLVAAITDGPDSAICGKVTVRAYPVEERAGLIWVYGGEGAPPPVETDIPKELLLPNAVVEGTFELRLGNWRHAVESGIDEAHGKYLHRTSPWMFFRELPTWARIHMERLNDGDEWLIRVADEVGWETDFPGLGRWPNDTRLGPFKKFWKQRGKNAVRVGVKLPGVLRAWQWGWTEYFFPVPADADHHRAILLGVRQATDSRDAALWKLRYRTYIKLWYHGHLAGQDRMVVAAIQSPPERLFRPDVSITTWRKLAEQEARGSVAQAGDLARPLGEAMSERNPVAIAEDQLDRGNLGRSNSFGESELQHG